MNKFSKKINCILRMMSFLGMFFVLPITYAGNCTQTLCKCSVNKADNGNCAAGDSHACKNKQGGEDSNCNDWCQAHTLNECEQQD
jgi:hypothetical protein